MEKLCDSALRTAMEEDLTFRQSLPRDYLNFMGIMNSDEVMYFMLKFTFFKCQCQLHMLCVFQLELIASVYSCIQNS